MAAPIGAPQCWGKQYGDEDEECQSCFYKTTCKDECLNNSARRSLPVYQPQSSVGSPRFGLPATYAYPQPPALPQPSAFPRPVMPQIVTSTPTNYPQPAQQQPQQAFVQQSQPPVVTPFQQHAPPAWNVPMAFLPRPPAPPPTIPQAWWQYSGESTAARLGKNLLLGAGRSVAAELLGFFTNWTWPTKPRT